MQGVERISECRGEPHADESGCLRADEEVQATVFIAVVRHAIVLDPIVEGYLDKHLDPLFVDMWHDSSPKSIHTLSPHDVRDHSPRRHGQLVLIC